MHAAAATHQHVAGDAGVEAARDQRQHIFLRADRETTNTFITTLNQQQTIVLDLKINGNVRVSQAHARRLNVLVQTAANVALDFNRAELVFTTTLHAHAEGFAFDLVAVLYQRLFEDIVHIAERNVFHFQNMMNTEEYGSARREYQDVCFRLSRGLQRGPSDAPQRAFRRSVLIRYECSR